MWSISKNYPSRSIYSAGLRGQEIINLKISDIDFERRTIHIRQSKYKKDRIVPLAQSMAVGLKKYLKAENPHIWLFNGKEPDARYSVRGLSWVMRENLKKTSITKGCKSATFRCIRTSIALFPLPGILWTVNGKTSGVRDCTSIRFTN
ncbi:MAG: tyrosine-type recombinase/integrase [Mangrovibacterium sp.]